MNDTASGIPAWLQRAMPAWLAANPALAESIWAAAKAIWNGVLTIIVAAWAFAPPEVADDPVKLAQFVLSHWWGASAPLIFAYLKTRTAFNKAAASTPTPAEPGKEP